MSTSCLYWGPNDMLQTVKLGLIGALLSQTRCYILSINRFVLLTLQQHRIRVVMGCGCNGVSKEVVVAHFVLFYSFSSPNLHPCGGGGARCRT